MDEKKKQALREKELKRRQKLEEQKIDLRTLNSGRKPEGDLPKKHVVPVRLDKNQVDWLDSQEGGRSTVIDRLIRNAMKKGKPV